MAAYKSHLACIFKTKSPKTNLLNNVPKVISLKTRDGSHFTKYKTSKNTQEQNKQRNIESGPSFQDFLANIADGPKPINNITEIRTVPSYIEKSSLRGHDRKVYFDVYGCQMNVNDVEISWSVLKDSGYTRTRDINEADVILIMTCSIREGAEKKIWKKLDYFKSLKKYRQKISKMKNQSLTPIKIGVLGCMAERLKTKILEEEKSVDLVCGPDAYKDLPRMLAITQSGQTAVNVLLSLDETYADVMPVRINENSPSAFVSIMRGCDNMCTYCIVPFTRGRERSRPISSVLDEVRMLSDQGIKEVFLLGQNVNSYRDLSDRTINAGVDTKLVPGFKTIYKPKIGGQRFSDLLDKVSQVNPEMRIRFTSPHPKDFPDEVIDLIKEKPNICNYIHLPAQSGNDEILERMRRGYTREAYLNLVHHIRQRIPDITLSSDFIAGFCGETEEAHQETVSLMRMVKYNFAYCFPYSMRQKTAAFHKLIDDVPEDVKRKRHMELINVYRDEALKLNQSQKGEIQLVLVEGESKRSSTDMCGRNNGFVKVVFPNTDIATGYGNSPRRQVQKGDYVAVQILSASSQVLHGLPLYHTTLTDFNRKENQDRLYTRD